MSDTVYCSCEYPDFWGGHKFCGNCGKPSTSVLMGSSRPNDTPDQADTARLNFLLERPCRMPIKSTDGYIVQEWIGHTTGRGATPRQAIDAAMAALKEEPR